MVSENRLLDERRMDEHNSYLTEKHDVWHLDGLSILDNDRNTKGYAEILFTTEV